MDKVDRNTFDGLKRKHEALISAMLRMTEENNMLRDINNRLSEENRQCMEYKVSQENVIRTHLSNSDNVVKNLQDEIILLKNRIKNNANNN